MIFVSQKSNKTRVSKFLQDTDLGQPQSDSRNWTGSDVCLGMQDWKPPTSFWIPLQLYENKGESKANQQINLNIYPI